MLGEVNPIALATEEGLFIAAVLQAARLDGLDGWAAVQGLALLDVLPAEKFRLLDAADVEFVLAASTADPAQETIVTLLRDRYAAATKAN